MSTGCGQDNFGSRVALACSCCAGQSPSFPIGIEGRNLVVDGRGAGGEQQRLPALAAELVALKPDLIVAVGPQPTRAAKDAAGAIPIVMVAVADPIGVGLLKVLVGRAGPEPCQSILERIVSAILAAHAADDAEPDHLISLLRLYVGCRNRRADAQYQAVKLPTFRGQFQTGTMALGGLCHGRMSRKGNCWDNAPMESFFHSLKTELVMHCDYSTRDQARASLFDYMEVFYNRQRRHSTVNYVAPLAFEESISA